MVCVCIILVYLFLLASHRTIALREVEYGDTIKMTCYSKSTDAPPSTIESHTFEWLKDGKLIDVTLNKHIVLKKGSSVLKLLNAENTDLGIYTCMDVTMGAPGKELSVYNVTMLPGKSL